MAYPSTTQQNLYEGFVHLLGIFLFAIANSLIGHIALRHRRLLVSGKYIVATTEMDKVSLKPNACARISPLAAPCCADRYARTGRRRVAFSVLAVCSMVPAAVGRSAANDKRTEG